MSKPVPNQAEVSRVMSAIRRRATPASETARGEAIRAAWARLTPAERERRIAATAKARHGRKRRKSKRRND